MGRKLFNSRGATEAQFAYASKVTGWSSPSTREKKPAMADTSTRDDMDDVPF
jgi:hypothetical protein